MSSTIRDWKTMWTVKWTADSTWGRSNVGPNTMETLGTDILLNSPCSITLREEESRGGGGGERGGEEGEEREEVLRRRVKDKALTGRCS